MTPFGQPALFTLEVDVRAPAALDSASMGPVRLVSISGGRVSGALQGRIMPGGTDWQEVRADGTIGIEARYLLELADGARIELQSRGQRGAATGAFWSSIWLRAAAPQWAHLNQAQFLGLGRKVDHCVVIDVFQLPDV